MLNSISSILWGVIGNWILVVCGLLLLYYTLGTWNYDVFQRRGIPSTRPKWPFQGDFFETFKGRSFIDVLQEVYDRGRGHGVFGVFEFSRPIAMIRDPELFKVIAVKEFDSFMNHRRFASEKIDPILGKNLFNLKDQIWKEMRSTMSPAFTTSKIKTMLPLLSESAGQFFATLDGKYHSSEEGSMKKPLDSDMKDVFKRLANDMIATAAFGVTCDSLKDPDNEFYTRGKILTNFDTLRSMIFFIFLVLPNVAEILGLRHLDKETADFFHSLVHGTMHEREKRGIVRPDMLHMLMQARQGQLRVEKEDAAEDEGGREHARKLTDDDITSLSLIFFLGGLDTVSTALCFAAILLSHHSDVQKRLQQEIDEVMEDNAGKPTYEAIQKMKYLDAVISEVLRLHPPAMITDRICQKDVTLPAGAMSAPAPIKKGMLVQYPIICVHTDPQYWSDPQKFDPERFSDENKHLIKPYSYLPFGLGPRICIGQRFALIEMKVALVHLLRTFDLHPSEQTVFPVVYEPGFGLLAKGGFWCGLRSRPL